MPRPIPWIFAGAALLTTAQAAMAESVATSTAITTEGAGSLGIGALVGAIVAAGFALRERFKRE